MSHWLERFLAMPVVLLHGLCCIALGHRCCINSCNHGWEGLVRTSFDAATVFMNIFKQAQCIFEECPCAEYQAAQYAWRAAGMVAVQTAWGLNWDQEV
jgi:hypothetical protein